MKNINKAEENFTLSLKQRKMLNDKTFQTAFLLSLAVHCLFLAPLGFSWRLHQKEKNLEKIVVDIKIQRIAILPKIDIMGREKRFKKIEQKLEQSKPEVKSQPLPGKATIPQISQESTKEKIDVINPDRNAMLRYQDMVKQRIEQARRYPLWAKKQGIEGAVYLKFSVLSNGAGQNVKLVRSSGSAMLDEEAIATIKRANPFPAAPKAISGSSIDMEVAIIFSLNGNYKK